MDKQANLQAIKDTIGKYLAQAGEVANKYPGATGSVLGGAAAALLSGGGLPRRLLAGLGGAGLGYFAGSQYGKAQENRALADANRAGLANVREQLSALQTASAAPQEESLAEKAMREAQEAATRTSQSLPDLSQ